MSELTDLIELMRTDPEAVKKILLDNPELRTRILELEDNLSAGERPGVDSFRRIYSEFFGRPLPSIMEQVVEEFLWALQNKKGVMLDGFRGIGKSTFLTGWGPAVQGWRPVGSTALVRINDQKAQEMGKTIAGLIQTNLGWKKIFPHVIPDERAGWSVENGFNVMDARITGVPGESHFEENYSKWRMLCLADHLSEQSLVCAGIESGILIGLHPTNGEWFDDLHNELNTRSQAEMKKVVDIVEGDLVPSWFSVGGSPTLGTFCTPWSENPPDAYQAMLKTGLFKHIKMPIFTPDEAGEVFPPTGQKVKLSWPEMFPMEKVVEIYNAQGTRFGQMSLLNVELSKPKNMRYQQFPAEEIRWSQWDLIAGVDPVGTYKAAGGSGISHFAMAYALKTPYNSVVIGDGLVEKCDADEGEEYLVNAQRTFFNTFRRASIESNGVGAGFIAIVTRNKGLKVNAHNTNEISKGNKQDRQYRFLQPLFANGSVLVSDAHTPFLDAVREYLDLFPNIDAASQLWDVGDALVLAIYDIPEIWTRVVNRTTDNKIWVEKKKKPNPYALLVGGRR
jgi:hypothetical protein